MDFQYYQIQSQLQVIRSLNIVITCILNNNIISHNIMKPGDKIGESLSQKDSIKEWKMQCFQASLNRALKISKVYASISLACCLACWYLNKDEISVKLSEKVSHLLILVWLYSVINTVHYATIMNCLMNRKHELRVRFEEVSEGEAFTEGREFHPSWSIFMEVEKLTSAVGMTRCFKSLAHYGAFVWGNVVYFDSLDIDCDQNIRTIGLVILSFSYMFSGFILIGLTLAILSFLLYCPFALTHKVYTFMSAYLKHRKLMKNLKKVQKSQQVLQSCRVCMNSFQPKETVYIPCKNSRSHCFHYHCLSSWLKIQFSCPICRNPF